MTERSPDAAPLTVVTARDANHNLAALLARAEAGEGFMVTKRGRPVARILPVEEDKGGGLTPEQEVALASFTACVGSAGIDRFDRDEIYADRADELYRRGGG